jgi:hypothetical protein
VDDVLAIVKKDQVNEVLTKLNQIYPTIKFTVEVEENGAIPFLDLMIRRNNDSVDFSIYRKPTDSQLLINDDSFHHPSHKHAAFHSMIHRLFKIPMNEESFNIEWEYIQETAKINGFDLKVINKIFKKHQNKENFAQITSLTTQNDEKDWKFIGIPFYGNLTEKLSRKLRQRNIKLGYQNSGNLSQKLGTSKEKDKDHLKKSGIYMLKCADCEGKYIGMTKRSIRTRKNEHVADCNKPLNEESAMAFHCITNNHTIDDEVILLREVNEVYKLSRWESLELHKHRNEDLTNIYKMGNSPSILFDVLKT